MLAAVQRLQPATVLEAGGEGKAEELQEVLTIEVALCHWPKRLIGRWDLSPAVECTELILASSVEHIGVEDLSVDLDSLVVCVFDRW